jgi:hypothetical protein
MEALIEKNFRIGFNHRYWLARAGGMDYPNFFLPKIKARRIIKGLVLAKGNGKRSKF